LPADAQQQELWRTPQTPTRTTSKAQEAGVEGALLLGGAVLLQPWKQGAKRRDSRHKEKISLEKCSFCVVQKHRRHLAWLAKEQSIHRALDNQLDGEDRW